MLVYLNYCISASFVLKYRFVICKCCFMCTIWKVFCFCAQYPFLMYHLESVLFLCTVHISYVPSGKCSVSVHRTNFLCAIWKVFCFCAQYTFLMYHLESVLFLCTVHICDLPSGKCSDVPSGKGSVSGTIHISDIPSGKCSVSVHSSHFWSTIWKVSCFCAQHTFMMCHLESVLFLCTVRISDVPTRKCSVSVHSSHFRCTTWKVFCFSAQFTFLMCHLESVLFLCTGHISDVPRESVLLLCTIHVSAVPPGKCFFFCAQYTFLIYHLESDLFLCTIHISDAQCCDISLRNGTPRSVARCFVLLVLSPCDINMVSLWKHVTRNSFSYECNTKFLPCIRIRVQSDLANHLVNFATPVSRNRKQ